MGNGYGRKSHEDAVGDWAKISEEKFLGQARGTSRFVSRSS